MICNVCGVREATLHLTEIVDIKVVEIHLCEQCAQEKGADFKSHFNFSEMLVGMSKEAPSNPAAKTASGRRCINCSMTYGEFSKSGRLGCAKCYETFQAMLVPMLKRIQRSADHIGKRPSKISVATRGGQDLRILQEQLRKSVSTEEFEEAAKLRDQIKKIQDKLNKVNKRK